MGSTKSPIFEHTGYPALDKITPVGIINRNSNKQHCVYHIDGHTKVQQMHVCNWRIQ